jgi:hypothetical protein
VRQTARHHLVAATLGVALGLSACGGDDGSDAADEAGAEGGGVPDPCSLIPAADLAALLGGDPGKGTSSAYDPDQRKICSYASGMILAVEVGDHYEESIDIIRDEMGDEAVQDVSGVGNAAAWQDVGDGAGQFIASGDDFFVGVTLPAGGREIGQAVAEAMLAAL